MTFYNYDAFNWLVKGIYIKDHINLQRVSVLLKPYTHTQCSDTKKYVTSNTHFPHINIRFKCHTKTWITL